MGKAVARQPVRKLWSSANRLEKENQRTKGALDWVKGKREWRCSMVKILFVRRRQV